VRRGARRVRHGVAAACLCRRAVSTCTVWCCNAGWCRRAVSTCTASTSQRVWRASARCSAMCRCVRACVCARVCARVASAHSSAVCMRQCIGPLAFARAVIASVSEWRTPALRSEAPVPAARSRWSQSQTVQTTARVRLALCARAASVRVGMVRVVCWAGERGWEDRVHR
jgi:hypothetical protein